MSSIGDVLKLEIDDARDAAVKDQLRQGLDPWTAFSMGCSHLGGRVEEDGPESFCRRSSPSP